MLLFVLRISGRDGAKSTLGFVTFAMGADARSALELKDVKLGDNTLKLKLAPNTKLKVDLIISTSS